MSETIHLPSYDEVEDILKNNQSVFQAPEVHGLLCGMICVAPENKETQWEKRVFGSKKIQEGSAILQQLYAATQQQLREFSFEFALLLPDDKTDINTRTEALGLWCQGFLTGLQQAPAPQNTSEDAADALEDITEIAQVNHGDIDATDENETAYYELADYIRLAALMLYHEYNGQPSSGDDAYLH